MKITPLHTQSSRPQTRAKYKVPTQDNLHIRLLLRLLHDLSRTLFARDNADRTLPMPRRLRIIVLGTGNLAREFFKGLPLGFGNQQSGEDTAKHEKREDLHDVVEPWVRVIFRYMTFGTQRSEDCLSDDGADLATGGAEAVGCAAVTSREAFTGHNERRGVGTEVEKELCEHVHGEKAVFTEFVVGEADDDKDDCQDDEAEELDRFAADGVDGRDRDPVAWDGAGDGDDQVADGGAAEDLVHIIAFGISDGCQDDGIVETETVKGDLGVC